MVSTNYTSQLSLVNKTFSLTNALDGIDPDKLDVFAGLVTNVVAPDGTVLYSNTNYASPDTTESSITKTGIPALLDVDGFIVQGTYALSYKVRVRQNIRVTVGLGDAPDSFRIKGNWVDNLPAVLENLTISGGTNAGTHQIASKTYLPATEETYVVFSAFVGTWNTGGYDDGLGYVEFLMSEVTKTLTYVFTEPKVSITVTSDCNKSLLTSKDTTDLSGYDFTIIERVHIVSYPKMLVPKADVVSSAQTINVSPIYTKTWTSQVELSLSADFGNGFSVYCKIYGTQDHDVVCSQALCSIYACMKSLVDNYAAYSVSNPTYAGKLYSILKQVEAHFMLYQVATTCGNVAQQEEQLGIIVDLLKTVGCNSCSTDTEQPQKVISLIGDVDTIFGGYQFYSVNTTQSGTGAPLATILNSTITGTPVWSRTDTGTYRATLTGAFPVNQVAVIVSLNNAPGGSTCFATWSVSDNYVEFKTYNASNALADDILNAFIEIRVY